MGFMTRDAICEMMCILSFIDSMVWAEDFSVLLLSVHGVHEGICRDEL